MNMLAAIHIQPVITIPLGLCVAGWIVWYWRRLGGDHVPRSRRDIRRSSIAIMFVSLPILVAALSFLDPNVHQRAYVLAWSITLLMMLIVIASAGLDAMNNLRLLQRQRHEAIHRAATELARAIQERKRTQNEPGPAQSKRLNGEGLSL